MDMYASLRMILFTCLCWTSVLACRPYWYDPRIHNLGNRGLMGGLHAAMAPLATRIIDQVAYDGVDVRASVLHAHTRDDDTILDLCCGTGTSTAPRGLGVDTSSEMIAMARLCGSGDGRMYMEGNAETWGKHDAYQVDVVTLMFALHEMPRNGRVAVLRNVMHLAQRKAIIVDIAPDYVASPAMLSGEPFLNDYLTHIEDDVVQTVTCVSGRLEVHHVTPTVTAWVVAQQ